MGSLATNKRDAATPTAPASMRNSIPRFAREFHDAVLLNGSVTLTLLEEQVEAYIARARG